MNDNGVVINIAGYEVIISACDYERVMSHKWYRMGNGRNNYYYFAHKSNYKHIRLHRFVVNCPKGMQVDHINNNTLDNRRSNLRICSHAENMRNRSDQKNSTSGYKGVSWHKQKKRWYSAIKVNNKRIYLGYFDTPEKAYRAYCEASKKYHGEFGKTNEKNGRKQCRAS